VAVQLVALVAVRLEVVLRRFFGGGDFVEGCLLLLGEFRSGYASALDFSNSSRMMRRTSSSVRGEGSARPGTSLTRGHEGGGEG
jgi:hypothetical protein